MINTGIRLSSIIAYMGEMLPYCHLFPIHWLPGLFGAAVCCGAIAMIAGYSRLEHGVDILVFIQKQRTGGIEMDGRQEARIVGLGITAVYVCLLLAAWGSA